MLWLLVVFPLLVHGMTLTYKMKGNEKPCFYTDVKKLNEKIAFYFAVQSGGQFDIDWTILSPSKLEVMSDSKQRQIDIVLAAQEIGEYSFCFFNSFSSTADKTLDFDISVEHEITESVTDPQNNLPPAVPSASKAKEDARIAALPMRRRVEDIEGGILRFDRALRYFKTRENRNFDTVLSTESRIFYFSVSECALIIIMAVFQVYVVQIAFRKNRRLSV